MVLTKKQAELRATVLDQIYAKRPISRIDISKETQITPATTGNIVNELIRENLVTELGELRDESVGRKKTLLDIAPRQRCYLGLEISETHLAAVIADNVGDILASSCQPYQSEQQGPLTDAQVVRLIKSMLRDNDSYKVSAVGIGLPGPVKLSESDCIISKSPHWSQLNLRRLQETLELPVYFSNKSHCLTLAERLFGRHASDSNFSVYHVARGIHCSYMYRGSIYGQDNFLIGEVGHTIINPEGELCPCGKRGCLQVYASEASLLEKAAILYRSSELSLLRTLVTDVSDISLKVLLTAYQLGDLGAMSLIHTACRCLAVSIANLCQLIDTEILYLDGELFSYPMIVEQILAQIHQEEELFPHQKRPDILVKPYSEFHMAQSAASLCVYHEFLEQRRTL